MGGNRTVGIGMDYSPTSKLAVQWTVDNLVRSGDRIVLIHVHSGKGDPAQKQLWDDKGTPLIPLDEFKEMNLPVQYGINPDMEVLDILETAAKTKQVTVVAKIYWGDPREKLCDAVDDLKLDSLVVGSRGLGAIKRVLLGSVSNYVVSHATCPVTVVKGSK
ncbi:Universal stress protein A-like protein [Ananas comosus]|uniref:Universal stress protein A-like protein n=1 Tax=Ananas comosus TaxID=4615 RepID=A0A199W7S4_ANACO|nr:Universal stress protein A-like protein [Ananas comosus]